MDQPTDTAFGQRLGLDLRGGHWPMRSELEAIRTAGFDWLQVQAPPAEMLASPRYSVIHAKSAAKQLAGTGLRIVLQAPAGLRAGDARGDRALEGLLEYAQQIEAEIVTYAALDFLQRGRESVAEELSLRSAAEWAEVLGVALCLKNLCPTYPGAPHLGHDPLPVSALVTRLASPSVAMALDVGQANVAAGLMGVELAALVEPVLPRVELLVVHDNLGARPSFESREGVDPLLLDLRLPPGGGEIPWPRINCFLRESHAPLVLSVDPQHRQAPAELLQGARDLLSGPRPLAQAA